MKKGYKNIDQVFNDKLKDFKADPPHEVWDEVVHSLDQGKRHNRMAIFMRVAAVISLLTALTVTALLVRDASTTQNMVMEQGRTGEATVKEETLVANDTGKAESSDLTEEGEEDEAAADRDEIVTQEVYLANYSEENTDVEEIRETTAQEDELVETDWLSNLAGRYIIRISGDERTVPDQSLKKTTTETQDIPVAAKRKKDEYTAENLLDEDFTSKGKWGVGTNATPLYSYRNLGAADQLASTNSYYNEVESGTIAYAGGIHVNFVQGKRLSFQSGIYYSKMGINVDHNYYTNNLASAEDASNLRLKYNRVQNTTGVISEGGSENADYSFVSNESWDRSPKSEPFQISELNATIYEGKIIQNFEYLEIPMLVRYRLIDRKIGFNVLGGVSTNLLVGSNAYYSENNTKELIGKTTDLKPINYSSIVGLGLDYAITKNLFINLEPTFRYYINSVNNTGLKSHPYSMGIFTGMSYYF